MAAVIRFKHLVLLALILLFCMTITATQAARSLGVAENSHGSDEKRHDESLKHEIKAEDDGVVPEDSADLLAMDYSPASKKPPIHN